MRANVWEENPLDRLGQGGWRKGLLRLGAGLALLALVMAFTGQGALELVWKGENLGALVLGALTLRCLPLGSVPFGLPRSTFRRVPFALSFHPSSFQCLLSLSFHPSSLQCLSPLYSLKLVRDNLLPNSNSLYATPCPQP